MAHLDVNQLADFASVVRATDQVELAEVCFFIPPASCMHFRLKLVSKSEHCAPNAVKLMDDLQSYVVLCEWDITDSDFMKLK